jgi:hypothetical protein
VRVRSGVARERVNGIHGLLSEATIVALYRGFAALLVPEVYGRGY